MKYLVLLFAIGLTLTAALAWETLVEEGKGGASSWRSIYQEGPVNKAAAARKRQIKPREEYAEHTRLSDLALQELGVFKLFGRGGSAKLNVVDLNASYFKFDAMDGLPTVGDDPTTLLEERLIPAPAYFSGVPDYSFTIYDWLNKNELCPPGDLGKACHVYFLGWLGNLNATHFGSQSTKMYKRYHTIAMHLADNAFTLHTKLKDLGDPAKSAYMGHVKEIELEALAYEAYAQHFLQDRWSIGHMWERWGAPDYTQLPNKQNSVNTMVAILSGLVHGSEAVVGTEFNVSEMAVGDGVLGYLVNRDGVKIRLGDYVNAADPLSSPRVEAGRAIPMTYRHTSNLAPPINGVGDDRLTDMNRKFFGVPYYPKDDEIDVRRQKAEMLNCSKAGWAEVIRKFGKFKGYGAWGANLSASAPGYPILKQKNCWDMWATNEAMFQALVGDKFIGDDKVISFSKIARLFIDKAPNVPGVAEGLGLKIDPRKDLIQLIDRFNEAKRNVDDPAKDTTLARGDEAGSIFGTAPGNTYHLAGYAEPVDFYDMPKSSKKGRDRDTLMGAFNRAHSESLCHDLPEILHELRSPEDERKQAVCEYLADYAYRGTDRTYDGSQKEKRKYKDQEVSSICAIRGQEKRHLSSGIRDELLSENFPVYINQGYVPFGEDKAPEAQSKLGYSAQSIANWCANAPLLLLSLDEELKNQNVVEKVAADTQRVTLLGRNLGDAKGVVFYSEEGKSKTKLGTIYTWMEGKIELDITKGELEKNTDYELTITTVKGYKSAGLFILRVGAKSATKEVDLTGLGPCREKLPDTLPVVDFYRSIGKPKQITTDSLKDLMEEAQASAKVISPFLRKEAKCIADRWNKIADRFNFDAYDGHGNYPGDAFPYRYQPDDLGVFLPSRSRYEAADENDNRRQDDELFLGRVLPKIMFYSNHYSALINTAEHMDTVVTGIIPTMIMELDLRKNNKKYFKAIQESDYERLQLEFRLQKEYFQSLSTGLNHWTQLEAKTTAFASNTPLSFIRQRQSIRTINVEMWNALSARIFELERLDLMNEASELEGAYNESMKIYAECGPNAFYDVRYALKGVNNINGQQVFFVSLVEYFDNDLRSPSQKSKEYITRFLNSRKYWDEQYPEGRPSFNLSGCSFIDGYIQLANQMMTYDYYFGDASSPAPALNPTPIRPKY